MLKGKKALVTGSSRGIGRKIVEVFLANGAEVWGLCSKPSAAKAELEAMAAEKGTAFHEICANVGDAEQLSEVVKAALAEAGNFDILVNNAGITRDNLMLRMNHDDWNAVINTNLTGAFNMTKPIVKIMMKQRSGSIVNMSSIVGVMGNAGQANYSAAKAGLIGFTKSLAKELGSRNIRVNAIAPGFIKTDMTKGLDIDSFAEHIPLKRLGEAEDIAVTVKFLAVDGKYVTGQVIGVDGGLVV